VAWAAAVGLIAAPAAAQITAAAVAAGFDQPVALVAHPARANVFYVVERGGLVRVVREGLLLAEPLLDLRDAVSDGFEGGLLGMAVAPNGDRVFVNFTNRDDATVIARFDLAAGAADRVDPGSRFDLRWPDGRRVIEQPFGNHNGGHLAFGPDGYLYIGLGDGGGANDPLDLAQNPFDLHGKMLRLDVSAGGGHPDGYTIPPDNPYAGNPAAGLPHIWSLGLRNPWRYSFDDYGPGASGGLFIADVGQAAREEINFDPLVAGGRNYGWRVREGRLPTPNLQTGSSAVIFDEPILDYGHSDGGAIVGGYVYRGRQLPAALVGRYFFADFITNRVWSAGLQFNAASGQAVVTNVIEHTAELGVTIGGIVSFARDRAGEIYVVAFDGVIYRLTADRRTPNAPVRLQAAVDGSVVTLRWEPPAAGPAATGYLLEAGSAPGLADVGTLVLPATQLQLIVQGVPAGRYYVTLRSLGPGGPGEPYGPIEVVVGR
jgi:glucose/arabinose dehydrogenase